MRRPVLLVASGTVLGALASLLTLPAAGPVAAAPTTVSAAPTTPAVTAAPPAPAPPPPCVPAPPEVRAAQVLVVGLPGVLDDDDPLVTELVGLGVGGVLLTKTNVADGEQVTALTTALTERSAVPPLIATDEEPGRVSSFGELLGRSSSARTMGARDTALEVRRFAAGLGAGLSAHGVDLDLAPVADLDDGPAGGIVGDRSFSADPLAAGEYALAFAEGLADAGVLAAAKHFPGHGRSATDSHARLDTVEAGLAELRGTDLAPFARQIDAGVPVVMLGHVAFSAFDPDLPASLSPRAYAELRAMGFTGVALTDSLGMGAVNLTWPFPEAAVLAISAGADAVLATDGAQARAMRDALTAALAQGRLPDARLDEAAARMLALRGLDPLSLTCTKLTVPALRVRPLPVDPGERRPR